MVFVAGRRGGALAGTRARCDVERPEAAGLAVAGGEVKVTMATDGGASGQL